MDAFVRRLPKPQGELSRNTQANRPIRADAERPTKRVKREESRDVESDQSDSSSHGRDFETRISGADYSADQEQNDTNRRVTDFEIALPPTEVGEEAIEQYEAMKSSQMSAADDDGTTEKTRPLWIKGKSSIYVDAFNLALNAVLDEESHLFDEKEMDVFHQWRVLDYEAQFL